MIELDEKQKRFVDEYLQTFSIADSAFHAGYPKEEALSIGVTLLANESVQEYLKQRQEDFDSVVKLNKMTKEKLLTTMYYQYEKANRRQDIRTATDILEKIAKWSGVEPDKIILEPAKLIINNVDENKI